MAQPSADELTQVREAVRQLVTEDQYKVFDECDFELLWKGEYRSVATLKAATRDGLMFIKLPMALVDILKPSQGAAASQLAQDILEIKDAQFAIQKMIETKSDCTRQASSISRDDLDNVLHSLHCVVIEAPDDYKDEFEGNLEDTTEFGSLANKYEQQQQEEYLATLKREVALPNHLYWVSGAKDNAGLLKTTPTSGGADKPFPIDCKTDECVALKRAQLNMEGTLVATVELKKKVVKQSLRQTLTQFICASLKSQLPVISVVTDMTDIGVAYYTNGQKNENGWTIIIQRVFGSAKAMMHFLGAAMRSIEPDVHCVDPDTGYVKLAANLPEPKRRRLSVPPPSPYTELQRRALVQQLVDGTIDVANLADFDE